MSRKTLLLAVADSQAAADMALALGDDWETVAVSSEADAMAQLEQRAFDALLVDFNLGSPDASQLLNQALEKRPETVRFLLAYEADLALVAAYVSGPHEILPKPAETASLKYRLERGLSPDDWNGRRNEGDPGTRTSTAPVIPAVYSEVLKVLDSPGATSSQVGEIIAGDPALTAEVLRLTKSAYLGLPRNTNDPVEAVAFLGLETVKALVMALRFLAEHSQLQPAYLSLERIWQHSINVAQLARDLILFETKDRVLAAEALVAGLLHDLGKVVLASNFDDLYGRVNSLARKQPVALWDIEKEMFGASHGEIGGCLAGMWNLPSSIVRAVALHHEPPVGEDQHLTPLAAVHIAEVLEHQIQPTDEFRVAPVINMPFLNDLRLLQRLPVWHAVFANRRNARTDLEIESAETAQAQFISPTISSTSPPTEQQLAEPMAVTRTATSSQRASEIKRLLTPSSPQRRWVYAFAGVVILGFLTLWLGTQSDLIVRARTPKPAPDRTPLVISPTLKPEPAFPVAQEVTPAMAVAEEAEATDVVPVPDLATTISESEPTVATVPQPVSATNDPPPAQAIGKVARPDFRFNGIIYTDDRPVAIVNGKTVGVGDKIGGATVIAINQSYVTLQVNDHRIRVLPKELKKMAAGF